MTRIEWLGPCTNSARRYGCVSKTHRRRRARRVWDDCAAVGRDLMDGAGNYRGSRPDSGNGGRTRNHSLATPARRPGAGGGCAPDGVAIAAARVDTRSRGATQGRVRIAAMMATVDAMKSAITQPSRFDILSARAPRRASSPSNRRSTASKRPSTRCSNRSTRLERGDAVAQQRHGVTHHCERLRLLAHATFQARNPLFHGRRSALPRIRRSALPRIPSSRRRRKFGSPGDRRRCAGQNLSEKRARGGTRTQFLHTRGCEMLQMLQPTDQSTGGPASSPHCRRRLARRRRWAMKATNARTRISVHAADGLVTAGTHAVHRR